MTDDLALARELRATKRRFDRAIALADCDAMKRDGDRIAALAREMSHTEPFSLAGGALRIGFALQLLEHDGSAEARALGTKLARIQGRFVNGHCPDGDRAFLLAAIPPLGGDADHARQSAAAEHLRAAARAAARQKERPAFWRLGATLFGPLRGWRRRRLIVNVG